MKWSVPKIGRAVATATLLTMLVASAQAISSEQTSANAPAKAAKSVWLSREASDVLKLSRGQVTEDVILAFVKSSKTGFSLSADEIVHLHKEGVSDQIIAAMLARPKVAPAIIASAPPAPAYSQAVAPQPAAIVVQQQPTVTYVQSPPVYVPSPVTYVYRAPAYTYYNPYPYYYPRYYCPRVSFNFGFGGFYGGHVFGHHHHHGGFHRGFHGHRFH